MSFFEPVTVFTICLIIFFIVRQVSVVIKKKFIRLITTPMITYFICAIAVAGVLNTGSEYKWLIIAALGLSVIADSVLMAENPYLFAHGLIFFLATHILYIIVFSNWYEFTWSDIISGMILLGLMVFLVYRFYKAGNLGKMMIPVIVYVTALSLIVFFSVNGAVRNSSTVMILRMCGAILFYISDVILGWAQFVKYYRFTTLYVWFFYAPGQYLIALSLFY
jgi:uncharacterized membrane protein YhhN